MRVLTVTDSITGEVIERAEGTFVALLPTGNGIRTIFEGDLSPFASALRPIIERWITPIMCSMMGMHRKGESADKDL